MVFRGQDAKKPPLTLISWEEKGSNNATLITGSVSIMPNCPGAKLYMSAFKA